MTIERSVKMYPGHTAHWHYKNTVGRYNQWSYSTVRMQLSIGYQCGFFDRKTNEKNQTVYVKNVIREEV